MSTAIKCGKLFTGTEDASLSGQTLRIENGAITYVWPSAEAPPVTAEDTGLDYSNSFVIPGLIDTRVHLPCRNAKTEEGIDLFAPVEYRALREMHSAQKVLKGGFTSLVDPTTTRIVSLAIRDAIQSGLFVRPTVTTSGRQITIRQGLSDWYPT